MSAKAPLAYRLLLLLLPPRFRRSFGADLEAVLVERLRDAPGAASRAWIWLIAVVDVLTSVPAEWAHALRRQRRGDAPGSGNTMDHLKLDLRFAFRSLTRRPGFTAIAVITLALGIGGATAIFSIVDGVLIRDLPYRDPSSLVNIWRAWPNWRGQGLLDEVWDHIHFPAEGYVNIRDQTNTLAGVEAFTTRRWVLGGEGRAEEISVGLATSGLFGLLGVHPVLGRDFNDDEALPVASRGGRVALLSHEFWTRRFGQDPAIVGDQIVMRQEPFTVIGVLPPRFRLTSDLVTSNDNGGAIDAGHRQVWVALGREEAQCGNCLELLGRLAAGVSLSDARVELQRMLPDDGMPDQLARIVPRKERLTQGFNTPLLVLFGASGILLLIACLNVAGLLFGEAATREQEITVRGMLGARRWRVVRQLLTESILLGLIGAGVGVAVAWVETHALLAIAPAMPRLEEVGLSYRALGFAIGTGVLTGIVFGLAPLFSLTGAGEALRSRGISRSGAAKSLYTSVVAVQVGLTVVLLIAAGLFGRSLGRLMSVDPGFMPEGLATLAFEVPARLRGDESVARFQAEVLRVAETVPGVTAVSAATDLPFPGGKFGHAFSLEPGGDPVGSMWHRSVLPNYHQVMHVPLIQGRFLGDTDGRGAPNAAVVSRSFAEEVWPGELALGKQVYFTGPDEPWTVVGVVGDMKNKSLRTAPEPTLYRTTTQGLWGRRLHLVARTTGDPAETLEPLQQAIWAFDPEIPITETGVMTALMREAEGEDRFRAFLMWTFAAFATVLAIVGIFGITARSVAARSREMGIRAALGATPHGLIRLTVREALLSTSIGLGLGLLAASAFAGAIRQLLFQIDARDPGTYLAVVCLTCLVCLISAYLPARRVTRIAPAEVLAAE